MASNKNNLASKNVKNPLFSTGIANFPAEEFTQGVLLVPPPKETEQLLAKGLGEVDTFLGQDVTDIGSCPLPSSDNINSDQTPTLLPPPPSIISPNFRSLPIRPTIGRPFEPAHPLAEPQVDLEPDFKQIPLDDSVPLYNPNAVLKLANRESAQELNCVGPKFEGGVPLYDPSYIGSVLPPHATKRPLPNRADNIVGPTPASLDPAYSSLSKHISTCSPSLVIDSGPPVTSITATANTSESRKSSSSSSVHELNTFNLQDHRPQPPISYPASSTLHSLPQNAHPALSQSHQSSSLISGLNEYNAPAFSVPLYAPQVNQVPLYPVLHGDLSERTTLGYLEPVTASTTSTSGLLSSPSNSFSQGVSLPGVGAPVIPSHTQIIQTHSYSDHTNNLLKGSSPELSASNLENLPGQNEVKSNEAASNLSFSTSIADYSLPSFLNPLNFFKKEVSSPSQGGLSQNDPIHATPFNEKQLSNAQSSGTVASNVSKATHTVAPPVIPQANEPSLIPQNPLPPPPLTGFQVSATPLSSLPKIHHSLSANPYSIHSQKKVVPVSAFKPEHYFTPIPVNEGSQETSDQPAQTDKLAVDFTVNQPEITTSKSEYTTSWNGLGTQGQNQQLSEGGEEISYLSPPVSSDTQNQNNFSNAATIISNTISPLSEKTSNNSPSILTHTTNTSLQSKPTVASGILGNPSNSSDIGNSTNQQLPPSGFSSVTLPPHQISNQAQPPVAFPQANNCTNQQLPPSGFPPSTLPPHQISNQAPPPVTFPQANNSTNQQLPPSGFPASTLPPHQILNQAPPPVAFPQANNSTNQQLPPSGLPASTLPTHQISNLAPPPVSFLQGNNSTNQQIPSSGFPVSTLPPHQISTQAPLPLAPQTKTPIGPPPLGTQSKSYRLGSLRKPAYAPVPDFGVSPISRPIIMDNQNSAGVNSSNQGLYQVPLQHPHSALHHLPPVPSSATFNAQSYLHPPGAEQNAPISDAITSDNSSSALSAAYPQNSINPDSPNNLELSSQVHPKTDEQMRSAHSANSVPSFGPSHVNSNFPAIPSISGSFQQNSPQALVSPVRPSSMDEVKSPIHQTDSVNVVESSIPSVQLTDGALQQASVPRSEMHSTNFFENSQSLIFNQSLPSSKPILNSTSPIHHPPYSNPMLENHEIVPNNMTGNFPQTNARREQQTLRSSNSPVARQSSPGQRDGGTNSPLLTSHSSVQQPFTSLTVSQTYRPVYHHWFFRKGDDKKNQWQPFSMADSLNLEQQFTSDVKTEDNNVVATDGGRYDVNVETRKRIAVFWHEKEGEVRRCSWFVKGPVDSKYQPYDENIAALLEEEYKTACNKNEWNRKVELADGEVIIIHSPNAIAHHQRSSSPDPWGNPPPIAEKHRVVKRGLDEFDIPEGEPTQVDHLILLVHGIGKVCDLRFRSLIEVVDDLRSLSINLVSSHFKSAVERGKVGRVEVLPVEWHRALHTETIDQRLNNITLPSIPKARQFTNETLLDILFYTSPVFCEKIVEAVGAEVNRVYSLYLKRNPGFRGGISLGGHSLGSLILFDMLCHQKPPHPEMSSKPSVSFDEGDEDVYSLGCLKTRARLSRRMSYLTIGTSGAGQPFIAYPQFKFQPTSFFALGSPIGMFVTVRGIESLGPEFKFPTCPSFFNIFHPNDPVAYRIEGLINPELAHYPAVLIPHHKGRKRMHLELKETMAHLTTAVKQKLLDSVKNTWNTVSSFTRFRLDHSALEKQVDKVLEDEILCKEKSDDSSSVSDSVEQDHTEIKVGELNGGRRIDYVLQEAPLETFNQYISAVRSHLVYWESEDTMLLMLKEVYGAKGITADCQVPQPILPFDLTPEANADPGTAYSHYTVSPSPSPSRQETIVEEPI